MLQTLGAEVLDERPFEVRRSRRQPVPDLRFRADASRRGRLPAGADDAGAAGPVLRGVHRRLVRSQAEVDGFNQLVLAAGLNWREVAVLRSYAHYLRQIGTPYTQRYVEQVLSNYPAITADLAALFAVQFDPDLFDRRPRASGRPRPSRIAAGDHRRAGRGDQPGRRPDPAHPALA